MAGAKTKRNIEIEAIVKRQKEIKANILNQIQEAVAKGYTGEFLEIKPDKPVIENFVVQVHMPSIGKLDMS
ncbi:MAG: hypothetical protein LBF57_01095 [Holosporaceae bacterium]|jgi:hypothetical protein|nr:hypothetical protein [Holosporaceae bacterium]